MITILLICYNHEKYLEKAINSVLQQKTNFPLKIKIYDDFSTDGSPNIIKKYQDQYGDKIEAYIREKNVGYLENIYDAIYNVDTKYFCILETDDYWCDENKLQLQFESLENNPDCSFCGHDTLVHNPKSNIRALKDGQKIFTDSYEGDIKDKFDYTDKFWVHTSSRLFKKLEIDFNSLKFKESIVNDVCLFWFYLSKGKMFYIDKVMSVYNADGNGLIKSSSDLQNADFLFQSLIKINIETNYILNDIIFNKIKENNFYNDYIINDIESNIAKDGLDDVFNNLLPNKIPETNVIPIMTCFDKNYVVPSIVAFYSLIENSCKDYFYRIYVLTSDISSKQQYEIKYCLRKFKNFSIEFVFMNNQFNDLWNSLETKAHFSKEVFYKLLTASIFPQYDKIIITDVDVVFLGDISPSYTKINVDEDFYLASIKPVGKILGYYDNPQYKNNFSLQEIEYLKSSCGGYLVMNLKKIRENNIEEKFIECFKNDAKRLNQAEQDVLNLVCANKIKFLHPKFLVCSYLYDLYKKPLDFETDCNFSKDELMEAYKNPVQLHFATSKKPWKNPEITQAEKWFFYLSKTPIFGNFMLNFTFNNFRIKSDIFSFSFKISKKRKIFLKIIKEKLKL